MAELDLSRRIVYRVDGMDDVEVQRGIVYRQDDRGPLLMDVYRPRGAAPPAGWPAIVFIPGGPIPREMLAPREWGFFVSYGELVAASGYAGIVCNHGLHAVTDYEAAQDDMAAAVDYARDHAQELRIDRNRLALWAFSGGGPLLSEYLRTRPPHIRCLVAFYALLDVRHLAAPGSDQASHERRRRLSPAVHIDGASVPVLVARAGRDTAAVNDSIDAFVTACLSVNAPLQLINHPKGQHAFDVLDDDETSRDVIREAVGFVGTHLK